MTMKITSRKAAKTIVIEVVGKLVGPWVKELEQCWRSAGASKVRVDLTGVTFIDDAGEELLRTMQRERVEFVAEGCFITGIVDEIRQAEQNGSPNQQRRMV
jgi:anti-anti-sigma regulatory factor